MLEQEIARTRKRRRKVDPSLSPRVIAYVRVSTEEQAENGGGLEAQRAALAQEIGRRAWTDVEWIEDAGYSAKDLDRPGIRRALAALETGTANVLVVAKLDRLSRSLLDFAATMKAATDQGWNLVALDLGLDLATPGGEMMAGVLATFAQYERRLIGERTRAGIAAKRASGTLRGRIGRPLTIVPELRERIRAMRAAGMSFPAIAAQLNDEGVPTARPGARWWPSTVQRAIQAA